MAIKASSSITLSVVVDVKATYRYYLLQSSTLATPSKPTTYPPSSSWKDAEPSYTEGSTNSLYLVDCTVFCDNTFSYSAVSKSSSYEAAKTAYNKAVNAQSTANDAQQNVEDLSDITSSAIADAKKEAIDQASSDANSKLEQYVKNEVLTEYKDYVTNEFDKRDENITIQFTKVTEIVEGTDEDGDGVIDNPGLVDKVVEFGKRIQFTNDTAITISTGTNSISLEIDDLKGIIFKKNGVEFGSWDGHDFHTGNIIIDVDERAQFGNFAYVPRSDGSLSFLKVSG